MQPGCVLFDDVDDFFLVRLLLGNRLFSFS